MLAIKGSKGRQPAYYKSKPRNATADFWWGFFKIFIIVLIISILLIGAVIVYAWYMSQYDEGNKSVATTTKPTPSLKKPHKAAPDAVIGVATQYVSNPVAPGENAQMSIHTNADARCTLTVKYGDTTAMDSGLQPKVSDDYGLVQWSWTIPKNTPSGTVASADAWCANAKHDAHVLEKVIIKASS